MTDWRKMYLVLCAAADEVIQPLERLDGAGPWAGVLRAALLEAEEIYIETTPPEEDGRA